MTARLGLMVGVAAVVAAALFGGWYFFLRGDDPAPVSLADAVASVTATPAASGATTEATATATSDATPAAGGDGALAGTWTLVAGDSFVGYRVKEELVSVGATEAVGRTSVVSGSLSFDGSAITSVEVVADMTALKSDDSRRDGQLRRQGIEYGTFPEATFVLAEPIAIEGMPAEGVEISAVAVGDLTLHGVTQRVTFPLQGTLASGLVVVVGSLPIEFADYDIEAPRALSVVSVEERGIIELQLIFQRG
ncbi:MAG: hypothetical protein AMXMBFR23_17090 [Chloroflexota bacterium]